MSENKGQKIYRIVMLIIITALITAIMTTIVVYNKIAGTTDIKKIIASGNNSGLELTLSKIRKMLEERYIGTIDDEVMLESAIKGYVAGLGDEYAEYYTPEEMANQLDEAMGNYVGIGIYMLVNNVDGTITVSEPMEGSPAKAVGIKANDMIVKVNDEEITKDNVSEMSNKIKGEEGTKVKLEIKRGEEVLTFDVERKKIVVSHVKSEIKESNIGYIVISDFDGGTAKEFKAKYQELKNKGIRALIIDIRSNGGGVVDESLEILDMLCEQDKTLLITVDKSGKEIVTKSKQNAIVDVPVVVLTNEYSASASEILAGALKDNEKATLVGMTTYGKGVIQELHQLTDGSGLKITTNEYFTPKRNSINKIGIEPDVEVDLSDKAKASMNLKEEDDNQLQKAIEVLKSKN